MAVIYGLHLFDSLCMSLVLVVFLCVCARARARVRVSAIARESLLEMTPVASSHRLHTMYDDVTVCK